MNRDLSLGFLLGTTSCLFIVFLFWLFSNIGYSNRLIIRYRSDKEYDRDFVIAMVNSSGIQTNFVNKKVSMNTYCIEWDLSNPVRCENK